MEVISQKSSAWRVFITGHTLSLKFELAPINSTLGYILDKTAENEYRLQAYWIVSMKEVAESHWQGAVNFIQNILKNVCTIHILA